MNGGMISGNNAYEGGGVYSYEFTMNNGTISGNIAFRYGGGVYSSGTLTMRDGVISGNTAWGKGGGMYLKDVKTFTKTGVTIYGKDAEQKLKNAVIGGIGHALYEEKNNAWRNATAEPAMNNESYGFWLNEEEGNVIVFSKDLEGTWRRRNFNNTLTISANVIKSSSSNYFWVIQKVSDDVYTLKRTDAANTMTITIQSSNWHPNAFVISGDSGSGENNWNGDWY
jgi:hypothetical protein